MVQFVLLLLGSTMSVGFNLDLFCCASILVAVVRYLFAGLIRSVSVGVCGQFVMRTRGCSSISLPPSSWFSALLLPLMDLIRELTPDETVESVGSLHSRRV